MTKTVHPLYPKTSHGSGPGGISGGFAQQAGQSLHEHGPDAPGAVSLHLKIFPFINSGTSVSF